MTPRTPRTPKTTKTNQTPNLPRRSPRCFQRDSFSGNAGARATATQSSDAKKCRKNLTAVDSESQTLSQSATPTSKKPTDEPANLGVMNEDTMQVDTMVKVFTFFCSLKKDVLRRICKTWGRRVTGNRKGLIYRNFLFLKALNDSGKDLFNKMGSNIECPSFEKFMESQERTCGKWNKPPACWEMMEALKKVGDKFDEIEGKRSGPAASLNEQRSAHFSPGENTPNFSLSEFARLVIILRDDDRAREALFRLGKEL